MNLIYVVHTLCGFTLVKYVIQKEDIPFQGDKEFFVATLWFINRFVDTLVRKTIN